MSNNLLPEPRNEAYFSKWENILPLFPDNYFDLAVPDPPYGVNVTKGIGKYGRRKQKGKTQDWDRVIPSANYFKELFRVSKNQIIWGGNYFTKYLPPSRCWLIWDKGEGMYNRDFAEAELAWTSFNANTVKFRYDALANGDYRNKIHPTQKPVPLYDWIYALFANPGYRILDTHMGSGSSRISAYFAGLEYLGCEADGEHFLDAEGRYQLETKKTKLITGLDVTESIKQLQLIL